MMRRELKGIVTLAAALGALLLSPMPGASAEAEEVKIGGIFDQSGPTSDAGIPYSKGVRDYVSWHNANAGSGARKVALIWQDSGYKPEVAQEMYGQFVSQGAVAIIGWGTVDTEGLRARANGDEIPYMSATYPETLTDPKQTPYNFVDGTTYSDQLRITLGWIAEQAAGKHVEVAVFHHDSPFGTSPLADGRNYIAEKNLDIGYKTYPMPKGETDQRPQLEKAKSQGATYVVVQNVAAQAAALARSISDGQYGMRLICLNWCGSEIFVKKAGAAAENAAAVMPFAPPGSDAAGFEDMEKALAASGRKLEDEGVHYVQGWYTAATMVAAAVSAPEIKGAAIKQRLESSDGVDTGGVSTGPIRFTADHHKGMKGARLFQVKNGRWEALSDALTP
jgi:branched-chain amino acid transport system substrate-binding protein